MTVHAMLFGHYRDAVPDGGEVTLTLPEGATVADAAALLAARDPRLADLPARVRAAVGADFVPFDRILADGEMVAFLPPMSGG